jgi:hypothetical protein
MVATLATDRQDCAIVFEVKVIREQEIHGASPVADDGPVERIVANVRLLQPRRNWLRLSDDETLRAAVDIQPPVPQAIEFRLFQYNR